VNNKVTFLSRDGYSEMKGNKQTPDRSASMSLKFPKDAEIVYLPVFIAIPTLTN